MSENILSKPIPVLVDQCESFLVQATVIPAVRPAMARHGLSLDALLEPLGARMRVAEAKSIARNLAQAELTAARAERDELMERATVWLRLTRVFVRTQPDLARHARGGVPRTLVAMVGGISQLLRRLEGDEACGASPLPAPLPKAMEDGRALLDECERMQLRIEAAESKLHGCLVTQVAKELRGTMRDFMRAWKYVQELEPDVPPLNLRILRGA